MATLSSDGAGPSTDASRLAVVRWVTAAGLLAVLVMARQLFLDHPFFGAVPVVDGLPSLAAPFDALWFAALALLVLPATLLPRRRGWALALCAVFAARCVWDRVTWQPFLLQYLVTFLVLWDAEAADGTGERQRRALDTLRTMVVAIYFWSGISKLNRNFHESGMQILFEAVMSPEMAAGVHRFALGIPVVEIAIAVGLLVPRLRRAAIVGGALTHLSILWMIGPTGLDYNPVVWPWNLVMVALLAALFWNEGEARPLRILTPSGSWVRKLAAALFVVCPALQGVGLWDPYLSFKLYSAQYTTASLLMTQRLVDALPAESREHVVLRNEGGFAGHFQLPWWSELELGAFAPPHADVYRHAARRVRELAESDEDLVLLLQGPPHWWSGEVEQTIVRGSEL